MSHPIKESFIKYSKEEPGMKRLICLILTVIMFLGLCSTAQAENEKTDPIVVNVIPPSSATNSSAEGHKMVQDWILK